jgi:predicted ester cyclase
MSLRDRVQVHYEGVAKGDPDQAVSVFTEDCETMLPGGDTLNTRDAFRVVAQGYSEAFPDNHFEIQNVVESGDWIVIEGVYGGTHTGPLRGPQGEIPPTGRTVSLPYADIFHSRGDLFDKHHVYFDQGQFMAQLGMGPQAG